MFFSHPCLHTFIAEESTGVAEKEELNVIRDVMMRRAIFELQVNIWVWMYEFTVTDYYLQTKS